MRKKKNPFPYNNGPFAMRLYEEELLGWMVHEAFVMKNKAGTVKGKLMAVRHENITRGLADPLKHRPRIWRGYNMLRRRNGPVERRVPAPANLLRWIK